MDSTAYRIPIVLSEDGLSHIPLATGQQLAPWSVPVGTEGDYINPADLISKEPNNPLVLDASGKLKVDMSRIINPSDTVLFIQNNLVSTQLGMELDNSQLILTGVNNTPIASVSLPIVPGLPIVAEFLHNFTPAQSDNVSGGYETGTYLHLRFAMSNGETKDIYVNYNSLDVEDYKVSYGLTLDNHIIGLKLAPDSGLSVTSQGLSVSGAYSAGNGVAISPQRAISVRAGTGLTFNSGELQALPYTAGNGVSITNRVVAIRLAGNGGLMLADGELAVKLSPNGYLVKTDSGLGVSDALLDMIDSAGDDAMARANEAYDLADGLSAQITGAYEVAEDAANSAALAQTQAATAIDVANNKVDRSGDTMSGDLTIDKADPRLWLTHHESRPQFDLYTEAYVRAADGSIYIGVGMGNSSSVELGVWGRGPDDIIPVIRYGDDTKQLATIEDVEAELATKADKSTVTSLTNVVAGKADASTVSALTNTVNNKADKATVTALASTVANKADSSDLADLADIVADKADASAVTALSNNIANKADKATVQGLASDLNNKVDRSGDTMTGDLNFTVGNVVKWEEAAEGRGYMTAGVGGLVYYENISNYSLPNNLDAGLVTAFDTFSNSVFMKLQFIIRTTKNNFFGFGIGTNYYLGLIKNSNTGNVDTYVQHPVNSSSDNSIASTYWTNKVISDKVASLGFNSSNILAVGNGGTGRTDGASQDVVVAGTSGSILAKSVGQVGPAKVLMSDVHADSVVERGLYICQANRAPEYGYPENSGNNITFMEVFHQGNYVVQRWELIHRIWQRRSTNKGESWQVWYPIGGFKGNFIIYISKSGSDSNTGLSSDYPVLTFSRAFQIADILARGYKNNTVYFRIGAGEWGDFEVANKSYELVLTPYDGQTPTAYSSSLPVFLNLQSYGTRLILTGLVIGYLRAYDYGKISVSVGYKRIAWMNVVNGGEIIFDSDFSETNVLEMNDNGVSSVTRAGFLVGVNSYIQVGNINIKYTFNGSYNAFLWVAESAQFYWHSSISINSSATFTGRKYIIYAGARINTELNTVGKPAFLDTLPGTQAGLDYAGSIYNGIPKGLLGAVAS